MRSGVAVTVEIEQPDLVGDLVERLASVGCLALAVDERSCRVVHPGAFDAAEEWSEIRFFVRAWQTSRGARATIRPERLPATAARAAYGAAARSSGFSIKPCS